MIKINVNKAIRKKLSNMLNYRIYNWKLMTKENKKNWLKEKEKLCQKKNKEINN